MQQPPSPDRAAAPAPHATPSTAPDNDAALQGEGNITAARRHRKSVEDFVESGKVQPAADSAAPADAAEGAEMRDAEAEARAHAKR